MSGFIYGRNPNADTLDGLNSTAFAILAGQAGGQTLIGGTAAGDDLTLEGTSHATKTSGYVVLQPTAGNVGIGTITPQETLEVNGNIKLGNALTYTDAPVNYIRRATAADTTHGLYIQSNSATTYSDDGSSGGLIHLMSDDPGNVDSGKIDFVAYGRGTGSQANSFRFINRDNSQPGTGALQTVVFIGSYGNMILSGAPKVGGSTQLLLIPANHTDVINNVSSLQVKANTLTITESFTTQAFNYFEQPTLTSATPVTLVNAATMQIDGAPVTGGSATITNSYALRVVAGATLLGGTTKISDVLKVAKSTAAQIEVYGWEEVGGAFGASGQILIGNEPTLQGRIHYDAKVIGRLYIDNSYNNNNGDIVFRTKTAGTAVNGLCVNGSGNVGILTTNPATALHVAGAMTLDEMTAPGAGAANTARIYAKDNGAGKTQLMVQFATGGEIQLAIEA